MICTCSYKADNKLAYFDLRDFDESILAQTAWELVRMAISIFIVFDALDIVQGKANKISQSSKKTLVATRRLLLFI